MVCPSGSSLASDLDLKIPKAFLGHIVQIIKEGKKK
jgi:hypothetical protein